MILHGKNLRKGIVFICIAIFIAIAVSIIWYLRASAGAAFFVDVTKAPLNQLIEYKWSAGESSGDNVKCTLHYDDEKCVLSFVGKGNMMNFERDYNTKSWHALNNMTAGWIVPIDSIIIGEGITSIGENTFTGMKLSSVTIPASIELIQENAFKGCISRSGDEIEIIYEGDMEQWNRIQKADDWCDVNSKKYIRSVKCSDGEILLENTDLQNQ